MRGVGDVTGLSGTLRDYRGRYGTNVCVAFGVGQPLGVGGDMSASATHGVSLQLDRAERARGYPRYPLRGSCRMFG
jgi:hypothetical protein